MSERTKTAEEYAMDALRVLGADCHERDHIRMVLDAGVCRTCLFNVIRAAQAEAREPALEEAARVCDVLSDAAKGDGNLTAARKSNEAFAYDTAAKCIRQLAQKDGGG